MTVKGRKRNKDRNKGDFYSSNSLGHEVCDKQGSVVQVDIQIQLRNSTLVPISSLLIGVTLEIRPLHCLLPAEGQRYEPVFVNLFL